MQGVFEMNIRKLGTRKNFLFWVEGSVGGCGRVWGSCKVGYTRWVSCEVSYVRWVSCEVGLMQGGLCEVGLTQGESQVRWVTRGGLREVRVT